MWNISKNYLLGKFIIRTPLFVIFVCNVRTFTGEFTIIRESLKRPILYTSENNTGRTIILANSTNVDDRETELHETYSLRSFIETCTTRRFFRKGVNAFEIIIFPANSLPKKSPEIERKRIEKQTFVKTTFLNFNFSITCVTQ